MKLEFRSSRCVLDCGIRKGSNFGIYSNKKWLSLKWRETCMCNSEHNLMALQVAKRFKEQDAREQELLFDLFTKNKQSGITGTQDIEQTIGEKTQIVAAEIHRQ